ncbi:DNA polymerase III subunit alpha [Paraliobacillus sp. PM-2]|uniref:DNA polymerase III subunit alpha n=1 Tax=Paraliobacillus sp. PM-2 TaxID=1462524 RepID=UPI00061BC2AA|nr:DNA polymerase III subunit alpha [Paraliobacillus sp. PM-2]CQR48120.1 DNA polymerase III subunit alpha [Paraliobacillus sp. PM-2]
MAFSHLFVRSGYSFMKSTVKLPQLIEKAKKYDMHAVALTDEMVMYGAVHFYQLAKQAGIKPILGMIVYVREENGETTSCVTLARNNQGYKNLLKLSSWLQLEEKQSITLEELRYFINDMFIILPMENTHITKMLETKDQTSIMMYVNRWNHTLHTNVYIGIQRSERTYFPILQQVLGDLPNQAVAINDVRYLEEDDYPAYTCLRAMDKGSAWSDHQDFTTTKQYFCSKEEMETWFQDWPHVVRGTEEIVERCNVSLPLNDPSLPKYPVEEGQSASSLLRILCEEALLTKYPNASQIVKDRVNHELSVIETMQFSDYFLIVWDFIAYAKNNGIMVGPGRGSASGSIVAYLLNITEIDPIKYNLLFERFLNPERISMPDIDVDFSDHRRDEVIAYVRHKYGDDHVAQIGTFGTFATRSIIRELAKTMEISVEDTSFILNEIPKQSVHSITQSVKASSNLMNYIKETPKLQQLFRVATKLEGLPRHLSTHAAGLIISNEHLVNRVALTKGHEGTCLTQFAMNDVEAVGLLKMDFLGLRNLTLIERITQSIEKFENKQIDLKELPLNDAKTLDLLRRAQTNGVFQLESQGMQQVLRELQPTEFEDIVAVNALYRPGPMEFISTYINRKHGKEKLDYLHADLQPILAPTYGVLVYQEQIMQIANQLAGFSLGQADILRRAVSKKNKNEMKQLEHSFLAGCKKNGYNQTIATNIFDWIVRFSNYGFNRSHAVAYSKISYQLAYLKAHYPSYFFAEILSSVTGQQDKIRIYINEAKTMGINLLPPSINKSIGKFNVKDNHIRVGLWAIKGIGHQVVKEIVQVRKSKPFSSLFDFCMRVSLKIINRNVLESLILVGAFDDLLDDRASLLATIDQALEQAELFNEFADQSSFFQNELELDVDYVTVEPFTTIQQLNAEKELLGVYISNHPLLAYREQLRSQGYIPLSKVKDLIGKNNRKLVAVVQKIKVIRTKRGDQMAFLTISDETYELDAVIFPDQFRQVRRWLKEESFIDITGKVELRNYKTQVIVTTLQPFDFKTIRKQETSRIYIKVNYQDENHALGELQRLADLYPGGTEVMIYHASEGQTYQLDSKYNLEIERNCLSVLYKIFGRENVVVKK